MRLWHLLCLLFIAALASSLLPQPSRTEPAFGQPHPLQSVPMSRLSERREQRGSRRNGGVRPTPLPLKNLLRSEGPSAIRRPATASHEQAPTPHRSGPMRGQSGAPPSLSLRQISSSLAAEGAAHEEEQGEM